ncbi:dihydroneopterin aldolase [Leptolyngbya valderiana BDU 20041]|nr:dihydroneopterin aldolase [Leptolyngbya valderiana BDU 20041]
MDCIQISNLRCYGYTGFLPEEQVLGQWFDLDLTLWVDLAVAGKSDRIEDTLDYRGAIESVKTIVKTQKYALIERLAEAIAEELLTRDRLERVRVRLSKPAAPIPDFGGKITVDIARPRTPEKIIEGGETESLG